MKKAILLIILATIFAEVKAQQIYSYEDPFDEYSYPVVKIGDQYWLAENMRSAKVLATPYKNDLSNRNTYGFLYTREQANDIVMEGWKLPSKEDWEKLENYVRNDGHGDNFGAALRSTSGWDDNLNGTDNYGFNALPGGGFYRDMGEIFEFKGTHGRWWSSSPVSDENVYAFRLSSWGDEIVSAPIYPDLLSVRLVTDKETLINYVIDSRDYWDADTLLERVSERGDMDILTEELGWAGYNIPDNVIQAYIDQGATVYQMISECSTSQYHVFLQE